MKAFLMHRDRDFDLQRPLPPNEQVLTQDLELNTLFNAMALGNHFLLEVAKKVVLSGLSDPDTIIYRQDVLKDCLKNPSVVREIYHIPLESIENLRRHWWGIFTRRQVSSILYESREMLQMFVGLLKKLRSIADEHAHKFESEGFTAFFLMINKELSEEYFAEVESHLKRLKFPNGVLMGAQLGRGNAGDNYILRKEKKQSWLERAFSRNGTVHTFYISNRDESGARALGELRDRGINLVANALAQSADHIDSFLKMLRVELAFFIGCLNLAERLARIEEPISFPEPAPVGERRHSFQGLYDVCLALIMNRKVVSNYVNMDGKDLVLVTGANQGGKSTFLRSIGLAQLMMQCGMFVPAESFSANICDGLFTHYKREEDVTMKSGKLDEELSRMSEIVEDIRPDSLVLFNESFAATNEREGSEIARQVTSALLEKRIKVVFVTHLYEFAHGFSEKGMKNACFLRAGRQPDGKRTFKLIEGEPLQTSYGEDVYKRVFGLTG